MIGRVMTLLLLTAWPAAAADEFKTGWRVEYQQDVFSGDVLAVAFTIQESERIAFDSSQFQVMCADDGKLVAAFVRGGISWDSAFDVAFRIRDNTINANFKSAKAAGGRAISSPGAEKSAELIAAFTGASNPIAFRMKDKQGLLPVIGAKQAVEAVMVSCN